MNVHAAIQNAEPTGVYRRHPFTVSDVRRMVELGMFAESARMELLDGELIDMPSEGTPHKRFKVALNRALVQGVGEDLEVGPDMSLVLAEHDAPEPDLYVFEQDAPFEPMPGRAVRLVVEIADSSLAYDLGRKAGKYASFDVREYWVVDLNSRQTHVLTQPRDGAYRSTMTVPFDQPLTPTAIPGLTLNISELRLPQG